MDLTSLEGADSARGGKNENFSLEVLDKDPLALHVREAQEMENDFLDHQNKDLIRAEKNVESTLLREHAQGVAKLVKESDVRYAKHSFLSLRPPVIATEDESALAKAYVSKGPIGRIKQVRIETQLERKRLTLHAPYAQKRVKEMEKELKILEEEEDLRASAEAALLDQLRKTKEMERLIKNKRAAANAATLVTPLKASVVGPVDGSSEISSLPKQSDDEMEANENSLLDNIVDDLIKVADSC